MTDEGGRRITVPVALRWSDLDPYAHVNNGRLLELLQEARVRAFWHRGVEGAPEVSVAGSGEGGESLTLVARQEIEYLEPIPYGIEPIRIIMWLTKLGGSSLEIAYEVRAAAGAEDVLHARAATVIVFVDAETQRPRRLGDDERAAWAPFLGAPVCFRRT